MKTAIIVINNQEYICEQTNSLRENDFFIQEYVRETPNICKVLLVCYGIFKYEVLNKENTYGWKTFRSMTDLSKLMGRKCNIELDTLFNKVIGVGFELN